jgi:hypothetical protein
VPPSMAALASRSLRIKTLLVLAGEPAVIA